MVRMRSRVQSSSWAPFVFYATVCHSKDMSTSPELVTDLYSSFRDLVERPRIEAERCERVFGHHIIELAQKGYGVHTIDEETGREMGNIPISLETYLSMAPADGISIFNAASLHNRATEAAKQRSRFFTVMGDPTHEYDSGIVVEEPEFRIQSNFDNTAKRLTGLTMSMSFMAFGGLHGALVVPSNVPYPPELRITDGRYIAEVGEVEVRRRRVDLQYVDLLHNENTTHGHAKFGENDTVGVRDLGGVFGGISDDQVELMIRAVTDREYDAFRRQLKPDVPL